MGRHHADVSTASKMATYEGAMKLMEDLRAKSYDFAVEEMEQLKAFAAKTGFSEKMMPWDMTFYAERQREELYSYQEEDLRPYFSLPRVLDGLFALVTRLFDVEIVAADGKAPVWDKDVRFFSDQPRRPSHRLLLPGPLLTSCGEARGGVDGRVCQPKPGHGKCWQVAAFACGAHGMQPVATRGRSALAHDLPGGGDALS